MLTTRNNEYYWAEGALDWEDAILEWEESEKLEAQVQRRRGDIARALKPVYGEHTLEKFAESVNIEYETLKLYKWVAEQYDLVQRRTNLSFSHHQFVAARPDRLNWLKKAEEGK
jgi:hypothetical protein